MTQQQQSLSTGENPAGSSTAIPTTPSTSIATAADPPVATVTATNALQTPHDLLFDSDGKRQQPAVWNDHFFALQRFVARHGHFRVSRKDRRYGNLCNWVYKQRVAYRKYKRGEQMESNTMNERRAALLESLGFSLSVIDGEGEASGGGGGSVENGDPDAGVGRKSSEHRAVDGESHRRVPSARNGSDGKSPGRNTVPLPLEFQFHTGFPAFYKEIREVDDGFSHSDSEFSAIDKDMTEAKKNDIEPIDLDSAAENCQTHQIAFKTDEVEKNSSGKHAHKIQTEDFDPVKDKADRIQQHKKFISVLEKYGSAAGSEPGTLAWHAMAMDLGWTLEEVKIYAYSYFKFLTNHNEERYYVKKQKKADVSHNGAGPVQLSQPTHGGAKDNSTGTSWTFGEKVLLDSLLLKYASELPLDDNDSESENLYQSHDSRTPSRGYFVKISVWDKISANIPDKNTEECREMGLQRLDFIRSSL